MLDPRDSDVLTALGIEYDVEVVCAIFDQAGAPINVPVSVRDGSVAMAAGSGVVRSTLDASFAPSPGLRAALAPGVTVAPSWVIRWGALGEEVCPFGQFVVEEQSVSYGADGSIRVTAPDWWVRLQRVRLTPETPTGNAVAIAARWIRTSMQGNPLAGEDLDPSTARVWGKLYGEGGDRDRAVRDLLTQVGLQARITRGRRLRIEPRPSVTAAPSWDISPVGRGATFDSATSRRSSADVINSYTVYPQTPGVFAPFYVEDVDPKSPTRVTGPMGRLTAPDPFIAGDNRATAKYACEAQLRKTTSTAFTTTVQAAANPFLEPDDAGFLTLPEQGGDPITSEKGLADRVVHPLIKGELMTVDLRSPQPLVDA